MIVDDRHVKSVCNCDYVSKNEFNALREDVDDLVRNVNRFVNSMESNTTSLVTALSGRTPAGSVPLETHKAVVKGLIVAFTVILASSIGISKLLPIILK